LAAAAAAVIMLSTSLVEAAKDILNEAGEH
jgi:hypothetical protein